MTGSIEGGPARRPVDDATGRAATRTWWDAEADTYQHEHEGFLGTARWIWGPEGWDDSDLDLFQARPGSLALELGCGAAAGSRWLRSQGVGAVGLDLSHRMLQHSRRLDQEAKQSVPVVQAHAGALPFADASFSVVATAYGALPFVADADRVLAEVARVLVTGGRTVLAVTHPIRWAFPDDPGEGGLTVVIGDWVEAIVDVGFALERIVEPVWPDDHDRTWGAWSRSRGRLTPGTAVFCCRR